MLCERHLRRYSKIFWLYLHARGLENVASWVFFSWLVIQWLNHTEKIPDTWRNILGRGVATLRRKYDTGRVLFALEALAAPCTFFEFSSSPTSSNISHDEDESKRKLKQDDSIHINNETVENCAYSICLSRPFEYVGDPSKTHRGPTGTDRRTLSVATGNYAAGRSAGYENQVLG